MLLNREPFKTLFKFFTFIGLWDEISVKQKRWTHTIPLIFATAFPIFIALSVFQAEKLEDILGAIEIVPLLTMNLISVFVFLKKKRKYKKLIRIVDQIEIENPDSVSLIYRYFPYLKIWFIFMAFSCISLDLIFIISPLFFGKFIFNIFTPTFMVDDQIYFYFTWVIQVFGSFYQAILTGSLHEFRCSLLLLLNNVMQYLSHSMRTIRLFRGSSRDTKKEIVKCVKLHLNIKKFLDIYIELNAVLLYAILYYTSTSLVCCIFVVANSEDGLKTHMFSICLVFFVLSQIFVPCYHGTNIKYQSEQFTYDLFSSDWNQTDFKCRKMLVFMMESTKKSMQLKALGFGAINLDFFLQFISETQQRMLLDREPYRLMFKIFTFLGFWDEISLGQRTLTMIAPIVEVISCALCISLSTLQSKDLRDVLDVAKAIAFLVFVLYAFVLFMVKKSEVEDLIELIDDIEEENSELTPFIDNICKLIKHRFHTIMIFTVIIFVLFIITPFIINRPMFPMITPKILQGTNSMFFISWISQNLMGSYVYIFFVPWHEFRCGLLMTLEAILKGMRHKVTEIKCDSLVIKEDLVKCIKLHLRVQEFLKLYKSICIGEIYLLLFFSTFVIVSVVFNMANSNDDIKANCFALLYVSLVLLQMLLACYHGSTIENQSEKLVYDLFSIDWLQFDIKERKMLIIMMENMKKVMSLKDFGFSEINLEFFVQVVNFVYSMYAVLQSMKHV
ncbi:hypothetical protein PVAND_013515 [Polypedilum vanderplanki]|uniref:Odorant receptor n=1 Tax=Polypedilum vanderplanki TaxID=319348 RepID=A0A9J6CQX8_POLVA|nr:hypothetical protein PVAND_013515 [Polypedilum vanderplanki]